MLVAETEQLDLPPMIPNAMDAQEAIALKLLKRYVNLRYEDLALRQPPSIYLTKRAGDVGYVQEGLSAQLFWLTDSTAKILRGHLANGTRPDEKNPSYEQDCINDRWPGVGLAGQKDMSVFADALEHFAAKLEKMATASLSEIAEAIDELFGERIGKEQRAVLMKRHDRRDGSKPVLIAPRSGAIVSPAIVTSSSSYREVPRHSFHPLIMDGEDDEQ